MKYLIILGNNGDFVLIWFLLLCYEVSNLVFFKDLDLVLELNFFVSIKIDENFLIVKWRL